MTTSSENTESKKTLPMPSQNDGDGDKNPDIEVKSEDDNLDEFGYEKSADEEEPDEKKPEDNTGYEDDEKKDEDNKDEDNKDEDNKDEDNKDEDNKIDDSTGYEKKEDEDKEVEKKEVEDKPDEKKDEDKPAELKKEDVDAALGELPEGYSKEKMSKFALDNKMTKDQIEAYSKLIKEESDQSKVDQVAQVKAIKKSRREELMNDPEFGGESFDKNVYKVNQLMDNLMPNTKKVLTDSKGILPPYIMRDLLKMSKVLNPTTSLVQGSPSKPKSKEQDVLDIMYDN